MAGLAVLLLVAVGAFGIYAWRAGMVPSHGGGEGGTAATTPGTDSKEQAKTVDDADMPLANAYGEDEFILINRGFGERSVKTGEDALALLDACAAELRLEGARGALALETEADALDLRHFRFGQRHEGISVYGRSALVVADRSGACRGIVSNTQKLPADFDAKSAISRADAQARAGEGRDDAAQIVPFGLTVYSLHGVEPTLTWAFDVYDENGAERVFVDAKTAEMLVVEPLVFAAGIEAKNADGMAVDLDLESIEGERFRMHDERRNIMMFDAGFLPTIPRQYGIDSQGAIFDMLVRDEGEGDEQFDFFDMKTGERYGKEDPEGDGTYKLTDASGSVVSWDVDAEAEIRPVDMNGERIGAIEGSARELAANEKAVTVYGYLVDTLDFYREAFGRDGYNGARGRVRAVIHDKLYSPSGDRDAGNAYSYYLPKVSYLCFDMENDASREVVAHELTHSLENSISYLDAFGESGALKEAVCDILGESVEDWANDGEADGDCDWKNPFRNFGNPHKSGPNGKSVLPATYGEKKAWGDPSETDDDRGHVHDNSTVITHAAYLMCAGGEVQGEVLSTKQLAQLMYLTLHSAAAVKECTFSQFRVLTESCARTMRDEGMLTQGQFERVMRAFDKVGVARPDTIEGFRPNSNEGDRHQAVQDIKARRDVALVLDVSSSMSGEPFDRMKGAARGFVETVVEGEANCGVVAYSADARIASPLTSHRGVLADAIDGLSLRGSTDIEAGLRSASDVLAGGVSTRRVMVLMSDGEPNMGLEGDDLIAYAQQLKGSGVKLYTVGFNEGPEGYALLRAMASDGCHYEVKDDSDLEAFFADIADEISGTRFMYVRAACPVEIRVTHDGETLSSGEGGSRRASFGSLAFEDLLDESGRVVEEDAVKVLRLKEGSRYDIDIRGVGEGSMDYTIGFANGEGDFDDFRTFEGVEVRSGTKVHTIAEVASVTPLAVDADGDGVVDATYRAEAGGAGAEVDNTVAVLSGLVLPAVAFAMIRIGSAYRWLWRTRRRAKAA